MSAFLISLPKQVELTLCLGELWCRCYDTSLLERNVCGDFKTQLEESLSSVI